MKLLAQKLVTIGAAVFLTLLLVEGAFRLLIIHNPDAYTRHANRWRAAYPLPYQQSNYYSPEFIDAAYQLGVNGMHPVENSCAIRHNNYSSRWFNVQEHKRATVNQLELAEHNIHVLGGSTIFCIEVPDSLTVTSQLQGQLTSTHPANTRCTTSGPARPIPINSSHCCATPPLIRAMW